jgi:hypothetical protein
MAGVQNTNTPYNGNFNAPNKAIYDALVNGSNSNYNKTIQNQQPWQAKPTGAGVGGRK